MLTVFNHWCYQNLMIWRYTWKAWYKDKIRTSFESILGKKPNEGNKHYSQCYINEGITDA